MALNGVAGGGWGGRDWGGTEEGRDSGRPNKSRLERQGPELLVDYLLGVDQKLLRNLPATIPTMST